MLELLRRRRSIRRFKQERISDDRVQMLVEAALRAPSSRGINPWEFVFVDDSALCDALSRSKRHGSEFLKGAPLAVVVCADTSKSDVWVEDCSIAAIIIQLAALSAGLGSCWAQIRNREHGGGVSAEEYVRELLGLPGHIAVEAILGIGIPDEKKRPVASGSLQREKIRFNGWESGS